jgi:hypothetical protein
LHEIIPGDQPDLGMPPEDVQLPRELCGLPIIVGVQECDELAGGLFDAQVPRAGRAAVLFSKQRHAVIVRSYQRPDVARAAIVDYDNFLCRACLGQDAVQGPA